MTTLTLSDGTVIDTRDGSVVRNVPDPSDFIQIPTHHEAREAMTRVKKRVSDLPDVPEKLNAVSIVAMYHLWGLDSYDIALATKLSEAQVERIKSMDVFSQLVNEVRKNILDVQSNDVRSMLQAGATTAAQKILNLLHDGDSKVVLGAGKDILDRAGHRPADVVEHHHKMEGGLIIEYRKRDTSEKALVIDAEYIEDDEDGYSA